LAAPLLLLALYFYMHLYLQSLWRGLATLPAVFPDGRTLDERAYPWLLVSVVRSFFPRFRETKPPFSRLTILLSIIFAWMLVPVTLAVFWLRYLPRSDWPWSAAHILLLVLVVCYGTAFYSRAKATLRKRGPPKVMLYAYPGTAVVVGLLAFLISDGVINGVPAEGKPYVQPYAHRLIVPSVCRFLGYIPFLDLKEAELSLKPPGWTGLGDESPGQIAQVQGARLQNRTLRYANLEGAFLVKADLSGVDLRGANLQHADLRSFVAASPVAAGRPPQ
jgi:Pentapeptide repeats (8 copies)